jgi:16S rRNA (cytidine1402-2'-O)-methyltransferase
MEAFSTELVFMESAPGTLYVVATPIGNLADLSPRAREVLSQVSCIAAEDTRTSQVLLNHWGISTRTLALHAHNEASASQTVIQKLQKNESVALITDAGTPGISDPGSLLVAAAHQQGIPVCPIPGPCAATTLLSGSGHTGPFLFEGFLPTQTGARRTRLEQLAPHPFTLVFYEAPHRIEKTMTALAEVLGPERTVVIGRELTKRFETIHRTTLAEALIWLEQDPHHRRGEFVLAVAGAAEPAAGDPAARDTLLTALLEKLSLNDAVKIAMQVTGEKRNALYQRALELKP